VKCLSGIVNCYGVLYNIFNTYNVRVLVNILREYPWCHILYYIRCCGLVVLVSKLFTCSVLLCVNNGGVVKVWSFVAIIMSCLGYCVLLRCLICCIMSNRLSAECNQNHVFSMSA